MADIEAEGDKERERIGHTLTEVEEEWEELSCLLRFLAKVGWKRDEGMEKEKETSHCLGRQSAWQDGSVQIPQAF